MSVDCSQFPCLGKVSPVTLESWKQSGASLGKPFADQFTDAKFGRGFPEAVCC